jgi:hypothetical protein
MKACDVERVSTFNRWIYLHFCVSPCKSMERVKGIEPSSQAWEVCTQSELCPLFIGI